ncbi:MAG: hypothetical protein U9O78_02615 [Patescibacteria group bacterium]|nr:hypothetical protein [Patescibacteria group bacterium]
MNSLQTHDFSKSQEFFRDFFQSSKNNEDLNEAETRFKFIDVILTECLSWNRGDISVEKRIEEKYADYVLSLPTPKLVIEAKREGEYFKLPKLKGHKRVLKLQTLLSGNDKFKDAVFQVSDYCHKMGIQVGAVCNGHQIIAFVANRNDGVPIFEGYCVAFDSLEDINNNFLDFWNIFSKEAFARDNLIRELIEDKAPPIPSKISEGINAYPGRVHRNDEQIDLQILSEYFLEDVLTADETNEQFLRECYSRSGVLSQYSSIDRDVQKTKYEELRGKDFGNLEIRSVTTNKGLDQKFLEILEKCEEQRGLNKRPILLVGDVGVGKTTFIENLIKVDASSILKNSITLRVDLGSKAILTNDIKKSIVEEITNYLDKIYEIDIYEGKFIEGVYHKEYQKFKKGIYRKLYENKKSNNLALEKEAQFFEGKIKDPFSHLRASLHHIVFGRKKKVIIFIDNCDQRSDDDQQQAFLVSQELAELLLVPVFITIRPDTFYKSLKNGSLSGYYPRAFTIHPPSIEEVIIKRLNFAKKIVKGEVKTELVKGSVDLKSLATLLEVMVYSFEKNKELVEFIHNISNGNVRKAIQLIKIFFSSGHVDTKKIIDIYNKSGRFVIPLHEFVRAIVYRDNTYFNPNDSFISNLFEIFSLNGNSYFLQLLTLDFLQKRKSAVQITGGYVTSRDVYEYLQGNGFLVDEIDKAVGTLYSNGLIDYIAKKKEGEGFDQNKMRLTMIGGYHLDGLSKKFLYIDAILFDTPIIDDEIRGSINISRKIDDRLDNADKFVDYLFKSWKEFKSDSANETLNWKAYNSILKKDIKKIRGKVKQRKARNVEA